MSEQVFWEFSSPELTRKRAEWADDEGLQSIDCPAYPGHKRAGKRLKNLNVLLPDLPLDDIVWTWYSECLVQQHVLDLFEEKGFTGYEVRPVKARFKTNPLHEPPTLWELVVTGWGGLAPASSGVRLIESCPFCGMLNYACFKDPSRLIDTSQWDGSDFFMVWPLPNFIFISTRAAEALNEKKFKGFRLVKPEQLKCVGRELAPGRLSHWMPEERARELGEPLGIY